MRRGQVFCSGAVAREEAYTMNVLRAAVLVLLCATVAYAQKVNVESDPAAPFATYQTYRWTAGTPTENPLAETRLHAAVDARLSGRGLALTSTAPDLIVVTHVTTN